MSPHTSPIAHFVEQFRQGNHDEAFHGLLEIDDCLQPDLVKAFRGANETAVRAFLLNVIWQRRQSTDIPMFAELLFDDEREIWQEAIDALVTLASLESIQALSHARTRPFSSHRDEHTFRCALDEAIEQVQELIGP